jgi:hypothetical protein
LGKSKNKLININKTFMDKEEKIINSFPKNSIYFTLKDEANPIIIISNGKFYWKDEEIDDIYNIYERFNEWLTKAEFNYKNK